MFPSLVSIECLMSIRTRAWSKLKYYDPKEILVALREIERAYPLKDMPYKVSTLRSRSLRSRGESRQCAIFCYGMAQLLGITLLYAESEVDDYDYIACVPEKNLFIPIQMKEVVPEKVNPETNLQKEIDKLRKYSDSIDLCVAIYVNRVQSIDVSRLNLSGLGIAELYLFGGATPTQETWKIVGNLLDTPTECRFNYPEA